MKVHPPIVSAYIALTLGLQGWTLNEIVSLKVVVAKLGEHVPSVAKSALTLNAK